MKRILYIPCPQCQREGDNRNRESKYYYDHKNETCSYCGGAKRVNILEHHKRLGIEDERNQNTKAFIEDSRFIEYLEQK